MELYFRFWPFFFSLPLKSPLLALVFGWLIGVQLTFAGAATLAFLCINGSTVLHERLLDNILRLPMSFYETTPLGRIVNRFSKDIDVIDTLLPRNVYSFLQTFVSILGTLFLICYSTPFFLTVLVPLCLLYIFIQVRESGRCIKVARYSFYNALKVNW